MVETTKDLLAELERTRDQFDWKLTRQDRIGGSGVRRRLRAVPKADPSLVMDPLGVLCYLRHGRTFTPDEWYEAGKLLGLQAPGMLAAAANDETSTGFAGQRELVRPLVMLRSQLVKAVGVVAD